MSVLESVPDEEKDWHPGSDKQVLDLVHPSLYCLRIGHSYVRDNGTAASSYNAHVLTLDEYESRRPDLKRHEDTPFAISQEYQWLPTDFKITVIGTVKPMGYINNLHPDRHRTLYTTISSVLARFIPLFERVLSDTINPPTPLAIQADPYTWYDHLDPPERDWKDSESCERYEQWERAEKWPLIPEPAPFVAPDTKQRKKFDLRGRTVQVIVKLANIVLTPENPA